MKQQLPLTKTAFADIASDLHIANSNGQCSGVFIMDLSAVFDTFHSSLLLGTLLHVATQMPHPASLFGTSASPLLVLPYSLHS